MRLWEEFCSPESRGKRWRLFLGIGLGLWAWSLADPPRNPEAGEVLTVRTAVRSEADAPDESAADEVQPMRGMALAEVLAIAREQNPTVDQFKANLELARAEILQTLAYPNPEIEGSIGEAETREEPIERAAEYELSIEQAIEWPHKRQRRREAAEAGVPVAEQETGEYLLRLRSEVAKAYHLSTYQTHRLRLAESNAALGAELEGIVQRRFEAGEIAEIDLIKARLERLKSSRSVQVARRELNAARRALDLLCGGALPDDFAPADELGAAMDPSAGERGGAGQLSAHPSLRRIEAMIAQQNAVIESERVAWHPDLRPGLSMGREMDADTFSLSLGVEIPLWNRNRGGIASAEAELARLRAEEAAVRLELQSAFEASAEEYRLALGQLQEFDAPLRDGAAEALAIETLLYQEGEHDLLQLLDARRTAQEIEAEYLQARYDTAIANVELEQALGLGGNGE